MVTTSEVVSPDIQLDAEDLYIPVLISAVMLFAHMRAWGKVDEPALT